MLPDILNNVNSAESGAKLLDNMGVDKAFLDEAYNKYSSYLTKIPGMNAVNAKSLLDRIKGAMRGGSKSVQSTQPAQTSARSNDIKFDRKKYPKL